MPITYRIQSRPSVMKWVITFLLIIISAIIITHVVALKKTIKVNEDEDYRVIQKNWGDLHASDVAHRHFYWPFVIQMNFAPDETTIDHLGEMGLKTFLHTEPNNFAIPIQTAVEISSEHFFRHSNDKLMLHSQFPVTLELVSNPGLSPQPYQGDDENIRDISEFLTIVNKPDATYPVQVKIYPNNFIFIPRQWLFRIISTDETTGDGLLEVFQYDTPFSRYL